MLGGAAIQRRHRPFFTPNPWCFSKWLTIGIEAGKTEIFHARGGADASQGIIDIDSTGRHLFEQPAQIIGCHSLPSSVNGPAPG